jgi:hypothetical protein
MTARAREEASVVEAVVDRRQALSGHMEKIRDIVRGILANGDDTVLALRQASRYDSAINHSLPVVFPRHAERRQIVNRRDERARPRPKHAPVARNMEHVQAMAPDQAWQDGLMPKNVFDRRAEALGDFDDPAVSTRKREEWQVFLKRKDSETMSVVPRQ